MNKSSKLAKTTPPNASTVELVNFVQAITGLAASDKKDFVRDISHLVQRGIQGQLAAGFVEEYKVLRQRGKIKEDYEATDQCRQEASYVFDAISSDGAIDEQRFRAMKNIFLNSAQETMSDRNKPLPIVLMKECSKLSMGELMVLEAAYKLRQELVTAENKAPRYASDPTTNWPILIAEVSGLGVPDMVVQYEQSLMSKGLLTKRTPGNDIHVHPDYHLSGMGVKLCEFIKTYEPND